MINTEFIKNIKNIDSIKNNLLENLSNIFKGLESSDIDMKTVLKKNIELTNDLANILNIDIEK